MSRWRLAHFALHTLVTFALLAATTGWVLGPLQFDVTDLPQDYSSARMWLSGDNAYGPLNEIQPRAGIPAPPSYAMVRTNPHPPVAVLLTAPYAVLDFAAALEAIQWTQLAALALTWSVCFEMFRPPLPGWAWALVGGLFGLWSPVWQGVAWCQPSGLLALGTAGVWALARAERPFAFGFVLAALTLLRPFVAIHAVLACNWERRKQAWVVVGLFVGGIVPFALLGIAPWGWYRLASDAGQYVSWCGSVPGVLNLGPVGGQLLYAAAAVALGVLRWRGLSADTTTALAATVAMLAYPLAWYHYDTSLIPVVAWVAARVGGAGNRVAVWSLVGYLLLRTVPNMSVAPGGEGMGDLLFEYQNWVQVLARLLLLVAVVSVARNPAAVSANAPS